MIVRCDGETSEGSDWGESFLHRANLRARVVFHCVQVGAFGEEELNLEARPDLMARIAADSDGAVISASSADEIRAKFKEHFTRTRPPRVERSSAWDRWWVLLGVVGLWGLSWAVRRSGGLV